MILDLNHVGLSVRSLNRSIAFYRDLFGMEVILNVPFDGPRYEAIMGLSGVRGRAAVLQRKGWNLQVELFEFEFPAPAPANPQRPVCDHGITHFCISVTHLEDEYVRLKAAGVVFHSEPVHTERSVLVYGRDPDGNVFELLERKGAAATFYGA